MPEKFTGVPKGTLPGGEAQEPDDPKLKAAQQEPMPDNLVNIMADQSPRTVKRLGRYAESFGVNTEALLHDTKGMSLEQIQEHCDQQMQDRGWHFLKAHGMKDAHLAVEELRGQKRTVLVRPDLTDDNRQMFRIYEKRADRTAGSTASVMSGEQAA